MFSNLISKVNSLSRAKKLISLFSVVLISISLFFTVYLVQQQQQTRQEAASAPFDLNRFKCSDNRMWEPVNSEGGSGPDNHDNLKLEKVSSSGGGIGIKFTSEAGDWKPGTKLTYRVCVSKTAPPVDKSFTVPNWKNRKELMSGIVDGVSPQGSCISGAIYSLKESDHQFSPPPFDYQQLCNLTKITPTPTKKLTPSPTPTPKVTPTPKPSKTPTPTPTPKITPTPKPSKTPTPTPTKKPSPTPTPTKVITPTPTVCPIPGPVLDVKIKCPNCGG